MSQTGEWENVPTPITRQEIELAAAQFLTSIRATMSPSTVNRKLSCYRRFGKWLGYPDFLAEYKPPQRAPGVAHPIEQGIQGVLDMIEAARKAEHKALISLTGLAGLRVGEARQVRPSHIDEKRMVITVMGKGSKERRPPLSDRCYEALLPRLVACWGDDELLVPLSDRQARRAITSVGKRCGMQVASHDMRMTFGTTAYHQSGGDIRAVQELLGHANIHTTEGYTEVSMTNMRKAIEIGGERV